MNFIYFYDFGPIIVTFFVGTLLLKYFYLVYTLSKQAQESIRVKAEAGFDKEAFYEKYRKIYESLPEEEKADAAKAAEAYGQSSFSVEKTRRLAPPRSRYSKEYDFFISRRTPSEILGVQPGDSKAQIKKKYRILAYKWHPDRFSHIQLSTEELHQVTRISQIINLAYEYFSEKPMAA